jgi:hypothetical protein
VQPALQVGGFKTPELGDAGLAGHGRRMTAAPPPAVLKMAADAVYAAGVDAYIPSDEIEGSPGWSARCARHWRGRNAPGRARRSP